jgi:hypothetical protein
MYPFRGRLRAPLALLAFAAAGCLGRAATEEGDAGGVPAPIDSGSADAGGPEMDAGAGDGLGDGGPMDAGPSDGRLSDAGSIDAGVPDAGPGVDAGVPGSVEYNGDGTVPYTTQTWQVTNGSSTMNVTGYLPSTPGPHPVVSFSCGSTQTAAGYAPYGKRLASYGMAMFLTDDAGILTNTGSIVPNAVYLVDTWMPANFAGVLDMTKVGLGGHSRGGAVSLLAAETGLKGKVEAWFGLDPVDNEFLMNPTEYARTDLSMVGIPTTFLAAQVVGNCNPAADGYMTLYPLAPAPTMLLVGVNAGHTEFELASGCTACAICTPDGTEDPDVVLAYGVRYFTAFFARELLGDTSVGAQFQGAGLPADVEAGLIQTQ